MKTNILGLAAIVTGLAGAAPCQARDIAGSYLVTFNIHNGATQCLVLTQTGVVTGYRSSGTWYSTTFPDWGGQYGVAKGTVHLAGPFGTPPLGYTTFDGIIMGKTLVDATFDEFDPTGAYGQNGLGSITVVKIPSCTGVAVHTHSARPSQN